MRFGRKRNAALLSLFLVLALLASACGQKNASTVGGEADAAGNADKPLAGKRVALIMEFNTGTFSQQYVQGVTEEVEKFGGKLTKFVAGNDKAKMASLLDSAITQRFDLILTDHGDQLLQPGVQKAVSQKIPVVVFDADVHVAGATTLSQDDRKMAELTLEQMKKTSAAKAISSRCGSPASRRWNAVRRHTANSCRKTRTSKRSRRSARPKIRPLIRKRKWKPF
ncbi:hypothetical protein CM49_02359 [Paenibacillus sp. P1XP2]|nr:hypothetical protein CM49_02359 [Paenibacillus sp. P1XP2]